MTMLAHSFVEYVSACRLECIVEYRDMKGIIGNWSCTLKKRRRVVLSNAGLFTVQYTTT